MRKVEHDDGSVSVYDDNDNEISCTETDGSGYTKKYDEKGREISCIHNDNITASFYKYNDQGKMVKLMHYNDGVVYSTETVYDESGKKVRETFTDGDKKWTWDYYDTDVRVRTDQDGKVDIHVRTPDFEMWCASDGEYWFDTALYDKDGNGILAYEYANGVKRAKKQLGT